MKRKETDQKRREATKSVVTPVAVVITRREWMVLGAILAAGIGLRVAAFSRSAVEHFDEGVYASNIYFGGPEYAYPLQRFYAPPLLPALIEAGMIVGLPPNVAALLPSFLAGCAMIAAVWRLGRSWFESAAGLSAAALVAFSDFHIALSAAALTDALLGLCLVLAVDAIGRSLAHFDFRWAVGAGVFTGLAWWTKYNGWLPLAIEGAGLLLLWLFLRPSPEQWMKWLGCFAVTCVVACAVWSPYFFSLQSQGGYGPIAANHAKYVVGLAGWVDSARLQLANQAVMEGWSSRLGVLVALALPAVMLPRVVRRDWLLAAVMLCIAGAALLLPTVVVIACSAAVGLSQGAIALFRQPGSYDGKLRGVVGLALVVGWWVGLLVATPCYSPYPRLMLPWLLAGWLGAAICWSGMWQAADLKLSIGQFRAAATGLLVLLVAAGVIWFARGGSGVQVTCPSDRCGVERIAQQVRAMPTQDGLRAIYTYGEPALYFQLRAAREDIVAPVQEVPRQAATIDGKAAPTFLIVGPHSQRDAQFQEQWAEAQDRFELVKTFEYQPSAIVWLDVHDPQKGTVETDSHAVRLYRLKP